MIKDLTMKIPAIKRLITERDMLRDALAKRSGKQDESSYYNEEVIIARVAQGEHRKAIGGLWDEIGKLQFEFMVAHGLKPEHKFLDVGCGSLRGGVRFIPYLNPCNYLGIDLNESLIDAGWNKELGISNLQHRQPRNQLVCLKDFEFNLLNERFDFALAVSVFTHLNFNTIRRCLTRLEPVLATGGKFYATFFEVPKDVDAESPYLQLPCKEVTTTSTCDPFHYRFEDFQYAVSNLSMSVHYHGDWNHHRNQKMLIFEAN